jgi:hypothetical protein
MKTTKFLLTSLIMMIGVLTMGASGTTDISSPESTVVKQCGVSNSQITSYLQNCSHHHTVLWVRDISGSCNSLAGIENCNQATVIVSDGIVVGHSDGNYNCPN